MTEFEPIPPQPAMTAGQASRLHNADPKAHRVPAWVLKLVKFDRTGKARTPESMAWYFRFLETGDAIQAVLDIGWKGKSPQWRARIWQKEFAAPLLHAVKHRRSLLEPLALVVYQTAMELGVDPRFNADPRIISNAIKAADSIVDRGDMPRGAAIKGLETAPGGEKAVANAHEVIDELVEINGIESVRRMKWISDYKANRDYVDSKWPPVLIEVKADA